MSHWYELENWPNRRPPAVVAAALELRERVAALEAAAASAPPPDDQRLAYLTNWIVGFTAGALTRDHAESLARALLTRPETRRVLAPAPAAVPVARPADEWHEDMGPVFWWKFPVSEPPYCGTPLDHNPPWFSPSYYTHFTPLVVPQPPQGGEVEP